MYSKEFLDLMNTIIIYVINLFQLAVKENQIVEVWKDLLCCSLQI